MEKIDILLATHNGAKYIEAQIYSILAQSLTNWQLIIHDDGSTDNTLEKIKEIQKCDDRIMIMEDNIVCGGAANNFLHLLINYSCSEFVIFCDQDDIWFESKLQILLDSIKNEGGPAAVYCNAFAYNGIGITKAKVSLFERNSLENSLFLNSGIQGCSLMFNKALLNILIDFPSFIAMHDHYITMGAVSFAKLKYVDLSLMLYRQHEENVTGNIALSLSDRIRNFFNRDNTILDRKHYEANKSFYTKFEDKLTAHQKEIFQVYLKFPDMNFLEKIYSLWKHNFSMGNNRLVLLLKLIFKNTI